MGESKTDVRDTIRASSDTVGAQLGEMSETIKNGVAGATAAVSGAIDQAADQMVDKAGSARDAVRQKMDNAALTLDILLDEIDNNNVLVSNKLFEHRGAVIRSAADTRDALSGEFEALVDILVEDLASVLSASVSEPLGASIDEELKVVTGDLAQEVQRIRTTGVSVTDAFTNMATALTNGIEAAETDVANSITESKESVLDRLDESIDAVEDVVDHATRSTTEASTAVAQQLGSCKDPIRHKITSVAAAVD